MNLVQNDYLPRPRNQQIDPQQKGPLKTSRAFALVFMAMHDTYGFLSASFSTKLSQSKIRELLLRIPVLETTSPRRVDFMRQAELASVSAGLAVARALFPRSRSRIRAIRKHMLRGGIASFMSFGELVGDLWVMERQNDGSEGKQEDPKYTEGFLRHEPDPNYEAVTGRKKQQRNFGRQWRKVKPFVLSDVRKQAFVRRFPIWASAKYLNALEEVKRVGKCNGERLPDGTLKSDIGIFWGYDGMPNIGTPPRLYLQVVLATTELGVLGFRKQVRVLTGVTVAMADAGLAAWFWKFKYDLWRPIIGIRKDRRSREERWNPIGIAFSNIGMDMIPRCIGLNPNFPAYPSGHAAFGTAGFKTLSLLLGKRVRDITFTFTSDEFNGRTIDGRTGRARRVFTQRLTMAYAIEQNKESRVFNGVHWRFDSDAGDVVGTKVAKVMADAFRI